MYFMGELCLLALILFAWAEKRRESLWFLLLIIAYCIGAAFDLSGYFRLAVWNLSLARLLVIFFVFFWAWREAQRKSLALCLTALTFLIGDIFIVNEPGILPFDNLLIYLGAMTVAGLTTLNYWGMAAAYTGGILIKTGVVPFIFGGVATYMRLPDPFLWHFSVISLIGIRIGTYYWSKVKVAWLYKRKKVLEYETGENAGEDTPSLPTAK